MDIPLDDLAPNEQAEVRRLLALVGHEQITLEDVWRLLDVVWDEFGCDNRHPDPARLAAYYQHPVWILNGLFIEQDPTSLAHRQIVVDFVSRHGFREVLDYGGGLGTLARLVARANPATRVDVFEPFPSLCALAMAQPVPNVRYIDHPVGTYDCVVSLDVLEHTEKPLLVLAAMIDRLRDQGYLVIGNCFEPVIKCHLPRTFHLRRTFPRVARLMGLRPTGECPGPYPQAFRKMRPIRFARHALVFLEGASRLLSPVLQSRTVTSFRQRMASGLVRRRDPGALVAHDAPEATKR